MVGARGRNPTRDHVRIANRLDFLQAVFLRQQIEAGEDFIEQIN